MSDYLTCLLWNPYTGREAIARAGHRTEDGFRLGKKYIKVAYSQPRVFTGKTDAKAESPVLWPPMWRTDSLEKTLMLRKTEGRIRSWPSKRWLDGVTDSMDMSLSRLWKTVKDREFWHAAVHVRAKSQTRFRSWTKTMLKQPINVQWKSLEILKEKYLFSTVI